MATVIGPRRSTPADGPDEAAGPADDGLDLPELADGGWMHHATEFAHTSFRAVARRLPRLVREAIALAWATNRRDTLVAIGLNLAAGVMTTLGLLATTGVLRELFAAGPTPDRVRAALPALVLAAAAVTAKGTLTVTAGWAQARLDSADQLRGGAAAVRDHHRGRAGRLRRRRLRRGDGPGPRPWDGRRRRPSWTTRVNLVTGGGRGCWPPPPR